LASSTDWETQASLLLSVATAILAGVNLHIAPDWLMGVSYGCGEGMVNLHITLLLDRIVLIYKIK
jgi:hypothetical protein